MRRMAAMMLAMALCAARAQALCITLALANVGSTETFGGNGGNGYNPFDSTQPTQTITFDIQSLVSIAQCNFFVSVRAGQSGDSANRYLDYNGNRLPYVVSNGGNAVLGGNNPPLINVMIGSFPVLGLLQTITRTLDWTIEPGYVRPASGAGYYTDSNVIVDLYEGTPGVSAVLRSSAAVTFRAKIPSVVDMSVGSTGTPFNLGNTAYTSNFGNVASGAVRNFDISVRSNDGYSVRVSSANGQVLKHSTAPLISTTIPYSIKVNNTTVNLTGGLVTVANQSGGTTLATGTAIPVELTLGTLTNKEPYGTYSDVLSLSVSAH